MSLKEIIVIIKYEIEYDSSKFNPELECAIDDTKKGCPFHYWIPVKDKFIEDNILTNKNFNKSEFREMHVTTAFKESKDLSDIISYVEVCQYDQDKNLILPSETEKAIIKTPNQFGKIKTFGVMQYAIIEFLEEEGTKLPASDIDFRLQAGDVDLIKKECEEMYRLGRIGRTSNYRYFATSSKKKSKQSADNIDTKAELKKLKSLLDEGLITKEQYELKSNKLLGI